MGGGSLAWILGKHCDRQTSSSPHLIALQKVADSLMAQVWKINVQVLYLSGRQTNCSKIFIGHYAKQVNSYTSTYSYWKHQNRAINHNICMYSSWERVYWLLYGLAFTCLHCKLTCKYHNAQYTKPCNNKYSHASGIHIYALNCMLSSDVKL